MPVAGRSAAQLGVLTRDVGVREHAVRLARPAQHGDRPVEHIAAIVHRHDRLRLDQSPLGTAPLLTRLLWRHRVDHRVPVLSLRGLLALPRRRLDQARLDAELAQAKTVVGLQVDLGAGEERVVVPACVLEQVPGQLLLEGSLIALQAFVILGREPDRVLVRDVRPGDRGGPVSVHLLSELARELHRLDLRGEGTAEHPLDEVLYALLKVSQDADGCSLSGSATCACTGSGNALFPVRALTILVVRPGARSASPGPQRQLKRTRGRLR